MFCCKHIHLFYFIVHGGVPWETGKVVLPPVGKGTAKDTDIVPTQHAHYMDITVPWPDRVWHMLWKQVQ